ncbi:18822_t:CDS:2, partial [Acaulospora morrowiae]
FLVIIEIAHERIDSFKRLLRQIHLRRTGKQEVMVFRHYNNRYKVFFTVLLLHLAFASCFLYFFSYKCDVDVGNAIEESLALLPPMNDTYIKPPPGVDPNIKIFMGILTVDEKTEIRNYLRGMYRHNNAALAQYLGVQESPITIKFVLGLPKDEYVDEIRQESEKYGDIVVLNITENKEDGKTFKFFEWFAENANDDSFIHLIHYYREIQDLPRKHVFYGLALNYTETNEGEGMVFMWGMGYTISRDLVTDIARSDWARSHVTGSEDYWVGCWICKMAREHKYLVHYVGFLHVGWPVRNFHGNPIHDILFDANNIDDHRFPDESILIHRIKNVDDFKLIEKIFFYNDGSPKVRVIRNSTTPGLIAKKEIFQGCWVMDERNQTWEEVLDWTQAQDIYKNWFYEAWGFKEGEWQGRYVPKGII